MMTHKQSRYSTSFATNAFFNVWWLRAVLLWVITSYADFVFWACDYVMRWLHIRNSHWVCMAGRVEAILHVPNGNPWKTTTLPRLLSIIGYLLQATCLPLDENYLGTQVILENSNDMGVWMFQPATKQQRLVAVQKNILPLTTLPVCLRGSLLTTRMRFLKTPSKEASMVKMSWLWPEYFIPIRAECQQHPLDITIPRRGWDTSMSQVYVERGTPWKYSLYYEINENDICFHASGACRPAGHYCAYYQGWF